VKNRDSKPLTIGIENCVCLNTGDAAIMQAITKLVDGASGQKNTYRIFDSAPDVVCRLYKDSDEGRLSFYGLLSNIGRRKTHATDGMLRQLVKPLINSMAPARIRAAAKGVGTLTKNENGTIRAYVDTDVMITTGGTYLTENDNISPRLKQFEMGQALGKKTIFFTQSLGPFRLPSNRARLKRILAKVPLVLLRDARSRGHLEGIIAPSANCHVVADCVFALADVARIQGKLQGELTPRRHRRVGVSVRQWAYVAGGTEGMAKYADSIRAMVHSLVRDHDYEVVFVSTCQGVPQYHHDDSLLANQIRNSVDADVLPKVSVDGTFHTPDRLMQLLRAFDFVISTRMHMMIMALNVGTPVIPIVYEFKTEELSGTMGLTDVMLNIDTITPTSAVAALALFLRQFETYGRVALEGALSQHADAMRCEDLIRPFLTFVPAKNS